MAHEGNPLDRKAGARAPEILIAVRLVTALIQGGLLYALYRADHDHLWPATDPYFLVPAALVSVFVPLIVISGLGTLRFWTLAAWKGVAAVILIGLGLHSADRAQGLNDNDPFVALWIFSAAFLFIAHALVLAGDADRRVIARYATYFDLAWKHIIQVALAVAFTGAFWLLFALANDLFKLIGLTLLDRLLDRAWFVIPASTLCAGLALHITDVRSGIVRGLRNLGLTLLSWLLVMMTALMAAFLIALLFTGLAPLWQQRSATGLLLVSAASLIVLVNAAYQDGAPDNPVNRIMRLSSWAASIALLPMVALAGYALWLRVHPYGFTPERVIAMACVLVAAAYALGYSYSLSKPARWLGTLERTNLAVSLLILAILLALFTPLADPARISVADQVQRLKSGRIAPDQFDYEFLRFYGARYGIRALTALAALKDPADATIARKAEAALKKSYAYEPPKPRTGAELATRITVYPAGKSLPEGFLNQDWEKTGTLWSLDCLRENTRCEAFFVDLDGAGEPEILMASVNSVRLEVFQGDGHGAWMHIGTLSPSGCDGMLDALRAGAYKPVPAQFKDLELGGRRLRLEDQPRDCGGTAPKPK